MDDTSKSEEEINSEESQKVDPRVILNKEKGVETVK